MQKDICLKSSKEIEILEKAINYLNVNLFESKLSKIKVTIQADISKKSMTYGWASCSRWINGNETAHELNITANALKRPFSEIWITLVHELIHIYAYCEGDPQGATSRQGRYHGTKFKDLCDKFYLITEKDESIGYITLHQKMMKEQRELFNDFKKKNKYNYGQVFKYQRYQEIKEEKPRKSTTSKYICECCEIEFTAKKGLILICGLCRKPFKEQEK